MTREEIETKVIDLVTKTLNLEAGKVEIGSHFKEDLDADSLGIAELGMAFEDDFSISIDEDDFENINTVTDAVNYIQNLLS